MTRQVKELFRAEQIYFWPGLVDLLPSLLQSWCQYAVGLSSLTKLSHLP